MLDFLIPERKEGTPMDENSTEAQRAADAILAEYDILLGYRKATARGRYMRQALALAYSRGALAAATEAVEADQRAAKVSA